MEPQNSPSLQPNDIIFQFSAPGSFSQGVKRICFAARSSGLFRSIDGGQTWESAYATLNIREALLTISVVLAPDFQHDQTVFAGLNGAILRSHDGGENWQRGRLPTPPPAISALVISPKYEQDATIFAGTNEDGVLKSSDGGRNWVAWNFGLLDLTIFCLAISPDFGADETLYAGTESGLFRSTNAGRAWKEVPLPVGFDAVLSLAISPNFAQDNTLFAGTENKGLLVSQDRGKSWQSPCDGTSAEPVNQIAFLNTSSTKQAVLILVGGTPLVSKDAGKTWKLWRGKKLAGRNVTTLLAPDGLEESVLVGFENGTIFQI
jgi:photosystem II stability/assembly factor-like uncharacterized protein